MDLVRKSIKLKDWQTDTPLRFAIQFFREMCDPWSLCGTVRKPVADTV